MWPFCTSAAIPPFGPRNEVSLRDCRAQSLTLGTRVKRYLVIGSNLSTAYYVLDLHDDALPVLSVAFGADQEIYERHPSLDEFLREQKRLEQEAAEEDAHLATASPWPRRLTLVVFILLCVLYVYYKTTQTR